MSLTLLLAAAPAALITGFLKTSVGGGIGLLLTPLLSLVFPPQTALALLAPLLLLSDPISVRYYWRVWDRRQIALLMPSALIGVAGGTWLLALLSDVALKRTIAVIALVFATAQLVIAWRGRRLFGTHPPAAAGVTAGLVTGVASTVAHSGGIVTGLYLVSLGLSPALVVGTGSAVYAVADVLKLAGYWRIGFLTPDIALAAIAVSPLLVVGAWLGYRVNARLPRRAFELTLVAIAVAGSLRLLLS